MRAFHKIEIVEYNKYNENLPRKGRSIIAQTIDDDIILYQTYNRIIGEYAVGYNTFGKGYNWNRMSWVKPNFLWMMYRAGWATKKNQEMILAIKTKHSFFKEILQEAVFTRFEKSIYGTLENWKEALANNAVRLQWDPDHNAYGAKLERKAVQLGLKGDMLKRFSEEGIDEIIDFTPFVNEQYDYIKNKNLEMLMVPYEEVFQLNDLDLERKIGITQVV